MRIAIIELMPYPYTKGGGKTHIDNLAEIMIKENHEVHLITSKSKLEKLSSIPDLKVHNVGLFPHKVFQKEKGAIYRFVYYIYRLFFEISFVLSAKKALKKINPDIVDAQSLITTALPCSILKIPFVATIHGIYRTGFKKLYEENKLNFVARKLAIYYRIIEDYNLKRVKKILYHGKETFVFYSKLVNNDSKFIRVDQPLDTEKFNLSNVNRENNQIICIARFTKQKALDKLILSSKELREFNFLIVGSGELEQELKKIAPDNVKFLGFLSPSEYIPLLQKSKFIILTSEFEGLPYAILEGMSCGAIPITTAVGDLPSVIKNGENGFLMKDNKVETIVKTIKLASQNKNLDKISKAARKTILDNFSYGVIAEKYAKIYKEAIGK